MFASFTYGVFSMHRQNTAFKILKYLVEQKRALFADTDDQDRYGIWHQARDVSRLSKKQQKALEKVSALPYLKGYNPAPDMENVTVHVEEAAYPGLNFVVSADEPKAFLMDMEGNILHVWHKAFEEVWPNVDDFKAPDIWKTYWRRAYPLDNGELLAMYMDHGLIRLDKDSNLLWAYKGRSHHDQFVDEDGNIYVLTRTLNRQHGLELESDLREGPIVEDHITVLSPAGEELKSISILDCFLNSEYAPLMEHIKVVSDILHTNTIEPIDGSLADTMPMFQEGHILISMREIHTIAVLDPEQQKVTWAITGMWKYQHEPRLLENGNILLFDNRGHQGKSKAIEFNPLTQEVVWTFKGNPPETFYSREAGSLDRLPNGNTLIVESEYGRAFEVTPAGKIVWEFYNPNRAGENNELIAALYDVVRVEPEKFDWLTMNSEVAGKRK